MTLPWGIYVDPSVLRTAGPPLGGLLTHELAHVGQWRRLGVARFVRRYLGEYLSGRRAGLSHDRAYQAISLEVEARRLAAG